MVLENLIFQTEVVEQRFTAVVLPHHDQQASDDRNQTEHGRMLSSNMLLRNLILLIDVTFSTPTPVYDIYRIESFATLTRSGLHHQPSDSDPVSEEWVVSILAGLFLLRRCGAVAEVNSHYRFISGCYAGV